MKHNASFGLQMFGKCQPQCFKICSGQLQHALGALLLILKLVT